MISSEHFKICPHMMSQCDRLCFLKMCESWHICLDILLHYMKDYFQKFFYLSINLLNLISGKKFHI